jgi:hypothetical protein
VVGQMEIRRIVGQQRTDRLWWWPHAGFW